MTDQELQSLRNMGNEAEAAADEIARLRGIVPEVLERINDELCTENERQKIVIDGYARIYNDAMRALRETVDERDRLRTLMGQVLAVK